MPGPMMLNDNERELLLELLNDERHELPHEIHYTDNREVREHLKERLHLVERLIQRLQEVAVR